MADRSAQTSYLFANAFDVEIKKKKGKNRINIVAFNVKIQRKDFSSQSLLVHDSPRARLSEIHAYVIRV